MYKGKSLKYRFNHIVAFFFLGIALFSACKKTPEYSFTPSIAPGNPVFSDTVTKVDPTSNVLTKKVNLNITFKDGDGDLGLDQSDINNDPSNKNYFLYQFRKKQGIGAFIAEDTILGQFQLLSPKEVKGPVDGTLTQLLLFKASDYFDKDVVYYKINIKDRAGNLSNQITTAPFVIKFKP